MKKGILQIFIALSLVASLNFADELSPESRANLDDIKTYELEAVEIIGTYQVDAHPETTSISAKDIKDSGARDLGQALRQTPGVLFREGTGSSNTQEIYIRGYSNNQICVYLDGIPMMSIYGGGADYGQFATAGLAGVEVLKSFVDSAFGANSLGGAVNMISARPEKEFEFSIFSTYIGSGAKKGIETRQGINIGTNQGKYYISVDYTKTKRDTYAFSKRYAQRDINKGLEGFDIAKGYAYNGHYENETLKLKFGVQPNENHDYSINYILSKGGKGGMLDLSEGGTSYNVYTDYPTKDTQTIYFLGTTFFTPELNLDSKVFYQNFGDRAASIDSTTGFQVTYRGKRYDDKAYGGIFDFNYQLAEKSMVKFGANAKYSEHISLESLTPADDGRVQCCRFDETASVGELSSSLFAQYSQGLGKFRLILGASLDRMDTTHSRIFVNNSISGATGGNRVYQTNRYSIGSNYTLQGVLYYDFLQGHSLHINVGKKYRMPSLRERYSTEDYDFAPNPNLKPEGAINYEVGYDLSLPSTNLSVAVYYNDLTNIFDSGGTFKTKENCVYPDAKGECLMIGNIPRGYSYGGEVSVNQGFFKDNALTIGGSYSYIQKVAKNTPQYTGIVEPASNRKITQYPNHIAQGKITLKATKKLEFIGLATYESAPLYAVRLTKDNAEIGYEWARFKDNEFVNFDIKANYEVFKGLTMNAGIYNLTDRDNYVAKYGNTKFYTQPDANGIRRKSFIEYHFAGRRYFVGVEYKY